MKFTYVKIIVLSSLIFVLSGCMYPNDQLSQNQVPNEQQLENVQDAVNQHKEKTNGLLPIKTKSSDTPIFEKYLIDFTSLRETNSIGEIPGNAYENGGVYQYALIHVEENPQVKLIDLRLTEKIRSINVKLNIYRNKHIYPPFDKEIEDGVYTIDYEKLDLDAPPVVESPYSGENLPIVMDTMGNLFVDYRVELNTALQDYEHNYKEGNDIRYILADNTPFLPVYSMPYTIKDGEPVFMN
ncbi:hypothetical protein [Ornithinibacillus halophilus]|uniref:Uncharacterized protein n=1 Tax=Ornithinibacillus halophilus TaxID=930117 RepID=A0A1M5CQF6_9BACI|nr:hypothetical protein [Ornithinibacillus halophilus]SHF56995.1 hypothetical protein SAMN05216225_1001346 [Ornithinibacillus halophilus]